MLYSADVQWVNGKGSVYLESQMNCIMWSGGVGEGRLSNEHKGTKRGGREESTLLSQKVCSTERLIRDVDMVKKGED